MGKLAPPFVVGGEVEHGVGDEVGCGVGAGQDQLGGDGEDVFVLQLGAVVQRRRRQCREQIVSRGVPARFELVCDVGAAR